MKLFRRFLGMRGGWALSTAGIKTGTTLIHDPVKLECLQFLGDDGMLTVSYCNVRIGSIVYDRDATTEEKMMLILKVLLEAEKFQREWNSQAQSPA